MSEIKKFFKSRWENGYILEADFSQLEVICLAQLSQDETLIADILSGRDMHIARAAQLFSIPESDFIRDYKLGNAQRIEQRRLAKTLSFQLQYGAGAASMAKKNKIKKVLAQEFISNYYSRYPKVLSWQAQVEKEVRESRIWDGESRTESGLPSGTGRFKSITGKLYIFHEYDNKWRPGQVDFSFTQMKNYPVQGLAADIVALILGVVFRKIKTNPKLRDSFLMINTVHDSILFDTKDKETLELGARLVRETMENAPKYIEEAFGFKFVIPKMKVDLEAGKNWMEIEKYEI